jgi:hypothetical protein
MHVLTPVLCIQRRLGGSANANISPCAPRGCKCLVYTSTRSAPMAFTVAIADASASMEQTHLNVQTLLRLQSGACSCSPSKVPNSSHGHCELAFRNPARRCIAPDKIPAQMPSNFETVTFIEFALRPGFHQLR